MDPAKRIHFFVAIGTLLMTACMKPVVGYAHDFDEDVGNLMVQTNWCSASSSPTFYPIAAPSLMSSKASRVPGYVDDNRQESQLAERLFPRVVADLPTTISSFDVTDNKGAVVTEHREVSAVGAERQGKHREAGACGDLIPSHPAGGSGDGHCRTQRN
ncbi:hypothetical protein PpBr36_02553 [Pyricularia pennisetigena]|uniref:hypothetical protein n=1 Tax=Pyricularia pennisetigena TaxID=1578925 RepID=UPI0011531889|nr:hypothetical protein PpBr36_02553 [Pyricularia pennisetigena]TLS31624.1 hypothetical protein PpBr36_02553 [Pyricularia pennisetigena]